MRPEASELALPEQHQEEGRRHPKTDGMATEGEEGRKLAGQADFLKGGVQGWKEEGGWK